MRNLDQLFPEWLKKAFILISLAILSVHAASEYAVAQSHPATIAPTDYNSFQIILAFSDEDRKIDEISERITDRVAERALENAAERAKDKAEARAENKAENKAEIRAENKAEKEAEARAEKKAENAAEKRAERRAEALAEREVDNHDTDIEERHTEKRERKSERHANKKNRRMKEIALSRLRKLDHLYDDNGFKAIDRELLILANKDTGLNISDKEIKERVYLAGLDMVLIRVSTPKGKNLSQSASQMRDRIDNANISLNHLFIPESRDADDVNAPYLMNDISQNLNLSLSNATDIRIGLIDTLVDKTHAALYNQAITIKDFVPYDKERPKSHGTAVAAILVGHDPGKYKGIIAGARLYAASVFFKYNRTKVAATTESLIRALDWLVLQKISVINMSLSGPADPLLGIAIKRVREKGSIIVAAVGNGGPTAAPLYPAAYPGVVAVTAVDKQQHVYLRANRGRYVAFSAPGVNISTANAGGGYQVRSGTSIAAPFVSAILAEMHPINGTVNIVEILEKNTIDLGKKGFDSTYGYGLIQAINTQVSALPSK
ncbi:hypothetical protein MNBD_ALPHA02-954 [hydrothermal vent metagenome]|uniref:Peptidase S8/S53 domain-containing protein n=1 Tax=hydrothermal vent metagenome TaxID=652676 RepID=A0A3B0RT78_9ZZZZ